MCVHCEKTEMKRIWTASHATKCKVAVIGGGMGGYSVLRAVSRRFPDDTLLVEPKSVHYFPAIFSRIGTLVRDISKPPLVYPKDLPFGAQWMRDEVSHFCPEENWFLTVSEQKVDYDYLVLATGLAVNLQDIKGLESSLGKNGVSTSLVSEQTPIMKDCFENFSGGHMVFTVPAGPIKCSARPERWIAFADDLLRAKRIRSHSRISLYVASSGDDFSRTYEKQLREKCDHLDVEMHSRYSLMEILGHERIAVFQSPEGETVRVSFDLMYVTPPMHPQAIMRECGPPLATTDGWVRINERTMRHVVFPNVYALGDCTSLPTTSSAASLQAQAQVLKCNLLADAGCPDSSAKTFQFEEYAHDEDGGYAEEVTIETTASI